MTDRDGERKDRTGGAPLRVVEATDDLRDTWDAFVARAPTGSFLQSWAWGTFQRAAGFRIIRLLVRCSVGDDIRAVCLLVSRPLPMRRSYLLAPWGPVLRATDLAAPIAREDAAAFAAFSDALRSRFSGEVVFVHIEPLLPATDAHFSALAAYGYRVHERSIEPKDTLLINLTLSEDDLLRGMHPKTRYNIRLARRHGVAVTERTDAQGLAAFLNLAHHAEQRGRFRYHPESYYRAMLETLAPLGMLNILVAVHRGEPLAVHLLFRFGDTVTYGHGAASDRRKHVMAPAFLQWEGMLRAKAAGATRYDLFGIAPPGASAAHRWFGITRFKRGFGGSEEHYVGGADLIGDPVTYRLYEVGRSIQKFLRA